MFPDSRKFYISALAVFNCNFSASEAFCGFLFIILFERAITGSTFFSFNRHMRSNTVLILGGNFLRFIVNLRLIRSKEVLWLIWDVKIGF